MSAERRWDQRHFLLEESTTQNGGARTIFVEHMPPGTTLPPHYHTRFAETFDLLSGSISVYNSTTPDLDALEASARLLEIGKTSSIEPGTYHKYKVGEEQTKLRVILTPGDADFERALKIMNGLDADGELAGMADSVLLMAVMMDLCNANLIGPAADMLAGVRAEKKDEIEALQKKFLEKYDTEEALKGLLAKE
jgi:quercetin dioxygenase-like cupin family protein